MIDLKELNLSQNQITTIESIKNMPNLELLNINDNPLSMIFPDAFAQLPELSSLELNNIQIKYPSSDLEFLKKIEGSLSRL